MAAWVSRGFYRLGVWALKAAVIVVGCAGSALLLIAAISFGLGVLGWLKTGAWSFYTVGDALRSELGMDVSHRDVRRDADLAGTANSVHTADLGHGLHPYGDRFYRGEDRPKQAWRFENFRLFPLEVSVQFGGSPMATSQRLSRGFHRIGLVLAALGFCWLLYLGFQENPPGQTETGFTQWVIFGAIFGAIIYGLVRAIDWVIGGFMSS